MIGRLFRRCRVLPAVLALAIGLALPAVSPRAADAGSATAGPDTIRLALPHPFALVDADGKAVTSSDFPGRWLLIYFGYTHCSDFCPTSLSAIAEALDELGPAAAHIQPVFITVDPGRDHGPMLREFTRTFDPRLIGLTGTAEQVAAAAAMLGIEYKKVLTGDGDYVVDHSTRLSVIAPDGEAAETFAMAEPYMLAAKLFGLMERSGMALGDVSNLRAYR